MQSSILWIATNPLVRFWWHASLLIMVGCAAASIKSLGHYGHILPWCLWAPSAAVALLCYCFRYRLCRRGDLLYVERCFWGYRLGNEIRVQVNAGSLSAAPGDAQGEVALLAADGTTLPVYATGKRGREALIVGFALLGISIDFDGSQQTGALS